MENTCCAPHKDSSKKSFLQGLLFGLLPHTFCIAFIVFSVIGATIATTLIKKVLLVPYFTEILIGISIIFATISIIFYLKKQKCLCVKGIKDRWKYITTMYTVTILVNVLMFFVVMPTLANISSNQTINANALSNVLTIKVDIPCSGHAPLITDELKKLDGINQVNFKSLDTFEIKYNPNKLTPERITALEIFKTYKAVVQH